MTPEAEIIERCARAMFIQQSPSPWTWLDEAGREQLRVEVLAVLRTLAKSEPTAAMYRAWKDGPGMPEDWQDMLRALIEEAQ